MYPIYTKRLVIRPITENEASFILRLLNDPGFLQFIGDKQVRNLIQARDYIRTGPMQSLLDNGFALHLVSLKTNSSTEAEHIGVCGLLQRDFLPVPDLGFAFLKEYTGKGLGYEAASNVLEKETKLHNLLKVMAITAPDNHASQALLKKLGFIFEENKDIAELGGASSIYIHTVDSA